jgi:succinate-semialdehyde dehydrogenase/glutarate-semialdehyde dehydrogenase
MANRAGIEKTKKHVDDAVGKGAKVAWGGKRPEGKEFEKGHFFMPTILTEVDHGMLVMHEETFGPAVGVMPYSSLDQVIGWANSTDYGLASYVYTDDLGEVDAFTRGLESGNVAFNNADAGVINAPYGGYKSSGVGYEHGPEGLEHYLRAKHVRIRYFNRT